MLHIVSGPLLLVLLLPGMGKSREVGQAERFREKIDILSEGGRIVVVVAEGVEIEGDLFGRGKVEGKIISKIH
jgi:hypothetical protein